MNTCNKSPRHGPSACQQILPCSLQSCPCLWITILISISGKSRGIFMVVFTVLPWFTYIYFWCDFSKTKQNSAGLDGVGQKKRKWVYLCVCVGGGGRQCLYGGVLKTPNMTISVKNVQPKGVATPYPTLIRPPYPTLIRPVSHFDPPPYPTLIRPVPHSDPPLRRERNRIRKKTETYIVAD